MVLVVSVAIVVAMILVVMMMVVINQVAMVMVNVVMMAVMIRKQHEVAWAANYGGHLSLVKIVSTKILK